LHGTSFLCARFVLFCLYFLFVISVTYIPFSVSFAEQISLELTADELTFSPHFIQRCFCGSCYELASFVDLGSVGMPIASSDMLAF
jgi:hypothetical protein